MTYFYKERLECHNFVLLCQKLKEKYNFTEANFGFELFYGLIGFLHKKFRSPLAILQNFFSVLPSYEFLEKLVKEIAARYTHRLIKLHALISKVQR